jgi:1,4-dihydroxy-2-naphthoate octaprenyltransferase
MTDVVTGTSGRTVPNVPGWRAWLVAIRPKTLPAAVAPVVVGTAVAIADGGFVAPAALAALLVALLLQIAANLANDVFDFRRGADTSARLGPARVTQSGLIAPGKVLTATWLAVAAAAVPGLYLIWRGGWPIALLGVLAAAAALAYTGGPAPFGYRGLGDLAAFMFFGPVAVVGTAFVQTQNVSATAVVASLPVGCWVTAILVVNNLRDLTSDRAAGKRTMAVMLGERGTRLEYTGLLAAAYLVLPLGWKSDALGDRWWLPWLSLLLAVPQVLRLWRSSGGRLNPLLAATARLTLVFALLLAGAILL